MSHSDQLSGMPEDFHIVATTDTAPYAAIAHTTKPIYGIQFHPEVTHTLKGRQVIRKFVLDICQCRNDWTMVCRVQLFNHQFIIFDRKRSSTKKLPGSKTSLGLPAKSSGPSAEVLTALWQPGSCTKRLETGEYLHIVCNVDLTHSQDSTPLW